MNSAILLNLHSYIKVIKSKILLMRIKVIIYCPLIISIFLFSCQLNSKKQVIASSDARTNPEQAQTSKANKAETAERPLKKASTAEILAKPKVPILCYHQIRNWLSTDGKMGKDYIVPLEAFRLQMKMLADSGYHTILPDELHNYLVYGHTLPSKPIMLTFDDTKLDQYTSALPEMNKYGFKGVFFIMTVSLGKPNYMSKAQVKDLSDAGHVIGSHTYDHQNVKKYKDEDWETQLEKPSKTLQEITQKEVKYFAYPFGLWNRAAIAELQKRGFTAAFCLSEKGDAEDPLFTIRRIIVSGFWDTNRLNQQIKKSF